VFEVIKRFQAHAVLCSCKGDQPSILALLPAGSSTAGLMGSENKLHLTTPVLPHNAVHPQGQPHWSASVVSCDALLG
jgi:hypothetical protein